MDKIDLKKYKGDHLDSDALYKSYIVALAQYLALVQAVEPTDEELEEAEGRMNRMLVERKAELELGARMAMERVKEDYEI